MSSFDMNTSRILPEWQASSRGWHDVDTGILLCLPVPSTAFNPSSAALLLLARKGLGVHFSPLDTYYSPFGFLIRRWVDSILNSGLMSELVCWFSPAIPPLRMLAHRKMPHLCDLVAQRRCLGPLFERPSSPLYSCVGETAPLLAPPLEPDDPTCASLAVQPADFRPIRLISQGVSGKVFLVQERFTEETFALKVIRKRSQNLAQVINEKDALCRVTGISWFLSLEASMHDDTNFYLVTTLYRTDLQIDLHLRGGRMPIHLARFYTAELICALEVLHAHGIIHRDIKPANVLLTNDGHVVLADFGMAKIFPGNSPSLLHPSHYRAKTEGAAMGIKLHQPYVHGPNDTTDEKMGTLAYAAPEVRFGFPYSYGVDFWSLGVLLHVMLTGRVPFGPLGEHLPFPYKPIPRRFSLRFEPGEMDDNAQALLEQILDVVPSDRPNIYELKSHRFFASIDWDSVAARVHPAPLAPRITRPPPSPKTLRIAFGMPYATDLLPDFTFTSSRLHKSRCELTAVAPDVPRRTRVGQLFNWVTSFVAKVRTWCISAASLFCTCSG